jgi:predicted RecA/RadA family phage recombinase
MSNNQVQRGDVIDFTTAGAVAVGAVVVVGVFLGIALKAAAGSGEVISVAIEGVFTVPKATGSAWTAGLPVVWDASAGNFGTDAAVTQAAGDVTSGAVAVAAAASGDTTGVVKLTPNGAAVLTP